MTRLLLSLSFAALTLAAAGCMSTPDAMSTAPVNVRNGVLTGSNAGMKDMTLYTFDRDATAPGKSVCNGQCATNWPPLLVQAGGSLPAGDYSVVTRDDGARQLAYKGKPLYFWIKDVKPGDKTGDNFNNVWHAATP